MYGHGGHLGHVTYAIFIKFVHTSKDDSTRISALIGQAVSQWMFGNRVIYMYSKGTLQTFNAFIIVLFLLLF